MTADRLRRTAASLLDECVAHPFFVGLGSGELDESAFRRQLVQRHLLDAEQARALAFGSAKAPDESSQGWFAAAAHAALSDDRVLHERVCREWGIAPSDLERAEALPATSALGAFFVSVAATGESRDLAVALAAVWGARRESACRLVDAGLPHHARYAAWIDAAADDGGRTDWLHGFVDVAATDDVTFLRWRRIFHRALRHELALLDVVVA